VLPDIVPGGVFPDYALPDHTGTVRTAIAAGEAGVPAPTLASAQFAR
jgi:hypothetical protein